MSGTPKYYVRRGRNQSGPYTNSELRIKATSGSLLPTDMIFKDGMSEWVKAKRVKGLFISDQEQIIDARVENFEPEYHVGESHEFEESEKKSLLSKAKSFIIYSVLLCVFLVFLITMSLSIVTTKEQRAEFAKKIEERQAEIAKKAEQQKLESEKKRVEEEKSKAEKELVAKEEAERNPGPVNSMDITKDEWKAIFDKAIKVGEATILNDTKLKKIFGKPSKTQTIGGRRYEYYECSDGTIQIWRGSLPINSKLTTDTLFSYELNDF